MVFLLCCSTLVPELFDELLLELGGCFDVLSGFLVGAEVEGTLLLQEKLIKE
jgi:hypothetical protein